MARQIEDITVKLGIQGFEELNKLRSSFRELTKVTNATDAQLDDARKRLIELKTELGNTARVNRGLTDAFGALLDEARRGSDVWKQLNTDLAKVRQESRLTDTQITALRDIIVDESKAHAQSANSIREHVKSLQDLRNQASLNGKVHQQLGADIQRLTDTLKQGEVTNREHYKSLGQILAVKPDAVLRQWQAYTRILQEGTAAADKLATAQRRLNQLSGAPRILERRRVSESAAITQDPEYLKRFGFEGKSLPDLPNTNAAYAQQIKELQQDLAHLDRTSVEYLQTVMQLAGVQREATAVARGYAQSLLMGIQTRTVPNSIRNIQEVITALRAEMQQLDTATSEGSATYAANANQVRNLEQQLNKLATAYRHVGDMATQAATAEQNAANARIRENYLNRALVRQQEAALAELGQRVRQGVSGTPLLLPAAGQTTAPGTGLAVSGGARIGRATGNIQQIFAPGSGVGGVRFPGEQERLQPVATPEEADRARRAYIAESDARRANAEAIEQQKQRMENLRAAVDKATSANTGSINSLSNLREALANLRNEIPATDGEFKQLTTRLQDVDVRAERLSTRASRRLSGMQIAQGVGAAISGGIFGGPEGLIGGLGGLAVGGVGGAFAGAAFGAQAGMFRQQLAGVTEYSAGIDKLQIALRGIVGSQEAYNQALAAAASVTRDLNIPQETAIQGMTRLSAAVLGAGGKVSDSAFAFRAINEAVKATGGNAEQADGALLALTQVFSKGKVSAEELNQIAERLPGTFTLFAKAAGMTGPELQKALQQGQVGLNDLMKFLKLISSEYGQTALKIAASSQEAGARLSVAFKNMQLEVGRALQPVGALLQTAFAEFIRSTTPALVLSAKLIGEGITLMYNAFASGIKTLIVLRGVFENLAKTMLVFGGITAGVFIASNITTFTNALKGTLAVLRTMLSIEKALLVVENARIAAQAILVSITSGAGKGKLIGAGVGALAGIGAVVGIGKLVENTVGSIEEGLSDALKGVKLDPLKLSQFPTPQSNDKGNKAKDKETRDAQTIAAERQRLANTLLDQQLRAADRVFQHQIELDRQRYELQKRLDDTQAQNRILRETGVARDVVSNFEDLQRSLRDIEERRVTAAENVRLAKQAQQSAAIRATFEGQGAARLSGTAGFIAKTGSTGDSTGPHLDARWVDGRRITAQDVDRYLSINGRNPSSFGVTSPYGPRQLFGRSFHGGIDLGTPAGSGIALKSGASLLRDLGFTGAGGYAVEIDTPEGRMRLLHLQAGSAKLPKGAATQQNRAIQAAGKAGIESLDVNQAESLQKLIDDNAAKERAAVLEQFTLKATEALREQNATMRDNNALQVLRNRLTLEGVSPERISLEEDLLRISQKQNEAYQTYLKLVAQNPAIKGELTNALAAQNEQYAEEARLVRESAAASDNAIANRIGQLRQQRNELTDIQKVAVSMSQTVESSLSTAISSAVTNLVTGAQTIKQTLAEMFSSIAKAFIDMAAQIIAKQLVIIALNSIAKIFQSSGASQGATPLPKTNWGGGSGGIFGNLGGTDWAQIPSINETIPMPGFANGGIMTSAGPLPLRRYAAGGVANSPQMAVFGERGPEAYVPLPDGRSIPVKMRQRTEALNRYKPISATGTIAAGGDPAAVGGAGDPAAGGPIDVRYSVERINNVEYVTAEQFRNGMQQAAAQGAQRGEQRALRSLQQSTAVRSRVGMR